VLISIRTKAAIVTLNTAGAKAGKTISINLGTTTDLGPGGQNGANTLGVGSGFVWVAGIRTTAGLVKGAVGRGWRSRSPARRRAGMRSGPRSGRTRWAARRHCCSG
jgi:hypothetical protein